MLHHDGEPWTATETYGHFAHNFEVAREVAEAGRGGRQVVDRYPWREFNDRWAVEDRAQGLEATRRRAEEGRDRLLAMLRDRPLDAWTGFGLAWVRLTLVNHIDEHLGFITVGSAD